jgi:hypothetical protein
MTSLSWYTVIAFNSDMHANQSYQYPTPAAEKTGHLSQTHLSFSNTQCKTSTYLNPFEPINPAMEHTIMHRN